MCAACASPSAGACTVGMPISRSSSRASSIISRVSRDVIVAFEYAAARSPARSASACSRSYRRLTARRLSISAALRAGGTPSNTNTSFRP